MPSFLYEDLPSGLRRPILILTFAGWNDAAESATGAAKFLRERWSARKVAAIDPDDFFNFAQQRPHVRFREGSRTEREISWPANEFFVSQDASLPRDVIVGIGVEPHLQWRAFARLIVQLVRRCEVTMAITMGALLAEVPHTRPVRLTGYASDTELRARFRLTPTRYEGPTGIVGVLNNAFRDAGLATASVWANVPHYISSLANPHATMALLRRLFEFLDWTADLEGFEEAARQFDAQLAEILKGNAKAARYVKELEARDRGTAEDEAPEPAAADDLPNAADLIHELEQLLRKPPPEGTQN
jgi:proteasome assembly chaperone (PAC2) family protein